MLLLDVNVWIALTFDSHVHYPPATLWYDAVSNQQTMLFCRMTQQGFLRLATNPSVGGADVLTMEQAWATFDLFLDDPRVQFVEEPVGIEQHWRNYTRHRSSSPKVWNDAYLAAFAIAGGYELITFDKAFTQYAGAKCTVLKS